MRSSLFDATAERPLERAADWLAGVLSGSLATGLCVVAVALLGLLMLRGRLPIRDGVQVVVGCFLLFGAPLVAAGLMQVGTDRIGADVAPAAAGAIYKPDIPPPPPSIGYDPYAGATIRQDRR